jgi:N-acetylmuramoyl-L-alanine amidase
LGARARLLAALVSMPALLTGSMVAAQTSAPPPFTTEVRKSMPQRAPEAVAPAAADPRPVPAPTPSRSSATALTLATTGGRTTVSLQLTSPVQVTAFTLAEPYRVILDIPDMSFEVRGDSPPPAGIVAAYRYGQLDPDRSRIVLDTTGPARIVRADSTPTMDGARLTVVLEPTDRTRFLAALAKQAPAANAPAVQASAIAPPAVKGAGLPVVVVDPGHGGLDPGAVGQNGVLEKELTLAVARQVHAQLMAKGRYDVRLTRSQDSFVSLDQRVQLSRQAGADLFISIHADTVGDVATANLVRGASVYTLAERASSGQAKALADKENAADLKAGLGKAAVGDAQITSILFDLMKREAQNFSNEFRSMAISSLGRTIALAKDPARAAAFRVLQQAHAPSVLVELGYMSHAEDAQLLQSPEWQRQVAAAIVAAVETYFARRMARRP